jgi:hypothetical protein
MGRRRNRKRRKARKDRVDTEVKQHPTRKRKLSHFTGKERRGDEAGLDLQFSGIPVPVEDPDQSLLAEQTALAKRNVGES